ncbi:hypothetical protein MRX96_026537 [Rhipicephalus microplus]
MALRCAIDEASSTLNEVHRLSEENQPQECSFCDLTLDSVEGLKDHLLEVHLPAPIFRCFECYERFSTYAAVLRHRNEKHNPKSSKCPDCPKTFKNALACRRHVLYTHYSSRLVNACKLCFRRYKNLLELRYHMALSHINELSEEEKASLEPLKKHCAQCDYVTFNRTQHGGTHASQARRDAPVSAVPEPVCPNSRTHTTPEIEAWLCWPPAVSPLSS